jgi:hypothetical protein
MNRQSAVALAALCFLLPGCASIVEGTTQSVSIETTPVDGAKCVVSNPEGSVAVTTPGVAKVHKTKKDMDVECDKDGYKHASRIVPSHFEAATVGNVIAGGGIGIIVDAADGASNSYPDDVSVTMTPADSAPKATPAAATAPVSPTAAKPAS